MRTLLSLFCLLLCLGLAACAQDDAASADTGRLAPTTPAGGDLPTSDKAEGTSTASTPTSFRGAAMAAAGTGAAPGASSASPGGFAPASPMTAPSLPTTPAAGVPAGATPPPADSAESAPKPSTNPATPAQSGTLTAGTWDDNRNFDRFRDYRATQKRGGRQGILPLTDEEHASAHDAFAMPHGARQTLDVALVVDTTGSMGDEITYLQTEFLAISRSIQDDYPDAKQRWALIVYRDQGDDYVTRWFDFTEDADAFRSKLAEQHAGGGGDFPEAPDAALAAMAQLAWRGEESTAKLAFWVADAPHHDEKALAMADALRAAREFDVRIYPVASSGIDEFTELTMRSAAQFTGGRYIFLTNDSGVGGDHKEPSIPCYFVTRLDRAILRMVRIELSGEYSEPTDSEILRTSGNPDKGSCKLASGVTVEVF